MALFSALYIEEDLLFHPRVEKIKKRFSHLPQFTCSHYGAIFNRKNQNFRIQKENPCLILAKKQGKLLQPIPTSYALNGKNNYYFSHLYNCPFDCRYCFLQSFFSSAHYVLFINYEDFENAILQEGKNGDYFFTGYDADSLAFESITGFLEHFLPFFEKEREKIFEIRTKSTNIEILLKKKPLPNVIMAYTLSPEKVARRYEKGAPSLKKRLEAIEKLSKNGFQVGFRFDPVLSFHDEDTFPLYVEFFEEIFRKVKDPHSVTLGPFRLPRGAKEKMQSLYPEEPLFFQKEKEKSFIEGCREQILKFLPEEKLFCMH